MNNKDIIVQLIQQDLKHNQLTQGLLKIGLDQGGLHDLDILSVVAQLMGVPKEKVDGRWFDIYISFMCEADKLELSDRGENLIPLAQKCYEFLIIESEIESRLNSGK